MTTLTEKEINDFLRSKGFWESEISEIKTYLNFKQNFPISEMNFKIFDSLFLVGVEYTKWIKLKDKYVLASLDFHELGCRVVEDNEREYIYLNSSNRVVYFDF